jgi:hypothetical protein
MPITSATWEVDIRKTVVQSQLRQKASMIPSQQTSLVVVAHTVIPAI